MILANIKKILYLKNTPKVGNIRIKKIVDEDLWDKVDWTNLDIQEKVKRELEELYQKNISVLTIMDESYPDLLKEIYNPPALLYYRGDINTKFPIAVVGTRQPSQYGAKSARYLVKGLVEKGAEIISGFAFGIDAVSHDEALKSKGKTLAVMGCGLDVNYPANHAKMKEAIVESGGCILSEYSLGTPAASHHFPTRNRIISGLSLGVLVVEAKIESGSLITARTALDQGRPIFAIPGSLFSSSFEGNHTLIREGAALVRSAKDIYEDCLPLVGRTEGTAPLKEEKEIRLFEEQKPVSMNESKVKLSGEETLIFDLIQGATLLDELVSKTGMAPPKILSLLTQLMLKGCIEEEGGFYKKA